MAKLAKFYDNTTPMAQNAHTDFLKDWYKRNWKESKRIEREVERITEEESIQKNEGEAAMRDADLLEAEISEAKESKKATFDEREALTKGLKDDYNPSWIGW